MKPLIFYVDDEPFNLTVFEAAMPDAWEIKTFDSPAKALAALDAHSPCVIVSDQRMPGMSGVQFLEISRKFHPHAIRIIVTGFSDEDLVVESVRKAQIFDYIRKPWDPQDLEASLHRAIEMFQSNEAARRLQLELQKREQELSEQNNHLTKVMLELERAKQKESEWRKELECWVPPFVLWTLQEKFPIRRDITGVTFDVIGSSHLHSVQINGRPLRSVVIQLFSEAIIRHGGWRESHSGDSAYGHFGLLENNETPADSALAVANEFRVGLRNLTQVYDIQVECGVALHVARNAVVDIHTVQLNTPRGIVTQKSFDTTSSDIDLLHRMEKLVHMLPGSNIIMSREFSEMLKNPPTRLLPIGPHRLAGQEKPVDLLLIPSDRVTESDLQAIRAKACASESAA